MRPGDERHKYPHVSPDERVSQVKVRKFVVGVAIENDKIETGPQDLFHDQAKRNRVDQV